jgi:hypothetical protein
MTQHWGVIAVVEAGLWCSGGALAEPPAASSPEAPDANPRKSP